MFLELDLQLLFLFFISFLAAFVKGVTGSGLATVMISFAILVLDIKEAVVLSILLGLYSGISMIKAGPVSVKNRYYLLVLISLVVGTVLGAMLLKYSPVAIVEGLMFIMLLVAGTLFTFDIGQRPMTELSEELPTRASPMDMVVGFISGLLTGMIGICLPVLVIYFGRQFSKSVFRHLVVLLFLPSAIFQTATFALNGLLTAKILISSVLAFPFLLLGVWAGSKVFHLLSERQFRKYLGIFLYVLALKLALS